MILTGHHLSGVLVNTDGGLHETGQRWQHIDWWVNLSIVQVTVDEHLKDDDP
jgi:hypothetical protein